MNTRAVAMLAGSAATADAGLRRRGAIMVTAGYVQAASRAAMEV